MCLGTMSRVLTQTLRKESSYASALFFSSKHRKYCSTCVRNIGKRRGQCSLGQYHRFIHTTSSLKMAVRIFEEKDHAALYAQYRPTYPVIVYETIINFYEEGKGSACNYGVAVDVGCGSGQSTRPLTKRFQTVTGTDVSAEQIANAKTDDNPNLTFRVGVGEDLSFLDNDSVDLVTVAQAFHWFDIKAFFKEVTRVLKPGGVLAVYGYGLVHVDKDEGQRLFLQYHDDLLGTYWDEGRRHVVNMYKEFSLPFPGSKRLVSDELVIQRSMPVDAYMGYLSTFSSWRKYLKEHPDADHLQRMRQRLLEMYNAQPGTDNPVLSVTWPIFLLIGRKPT